MGVVNVTPDSFFAPSRAEGAGARWPAAATSSRRARRSLDVGGESTRPGAEPVAEDVELARVLPVVAALAGARQGLGRHRQARRRPRGGRRGRHPAERRLGGPRRRSPPSSGSGWVAMHHRGIPAAPPARPRSGPGVIDVVARPRAGRRPRGPGARRGGGLRRPRDRLREGRVGQPRRCSRTSTSCATPRTTRGSACSSARAASGSWGRCRTARPSTRTIASRARSPSRCTRWSCGADVVRVHDVAATAQAAIAHR